VSITTALPVRAIVASSHKYYHTTLLEEFGSVIPYRGTLDLLTLDKGVISGYYRGADGTDAPVVVHGGLDKQHIWLDIADGGTLHVVGKVANDGSIFARAWYDDNNTYYTFKAKLVDQL